jgi:hypothetical protein
MAIISLPQVEFQGGRPRLVDSISVSRTGNRTISFVETADPYWEIPMQTIPLYAEDLARVEAFREVSRQGRNTVIYTPVHIPGPQAYWNNPAAPALANNGIVTAVSGYSLSFNSVDNGLTLMPGDLIGVESAGGYKAMCRIVTGAVAVSNAMTVTVEPAIPGYIAVGASVRFKSLQLNTRVLPGSFSIPDEVMPVASFTLVEVPK